MHFPIYYYVKVYDPRVGPFVTLGTSFTQTSISLSQESFMVNIVRFGGAVLEKKFFKHFPIYYYVKV